MLHYNLGHEQREGHIEMNSASEHLEQKLRGPFLLVVVDEKAQYAAHDVIDALGRKNIRSITVRGDQDGLAFDDDGSLEEKIAHLKTLRGYLGANFRFRSSGENGTAFFAPKAGGLWNAQNIMEISLASLKA